MIKNTTNHNSYRKSLCQQLAIALRFLATQEKMTKETVDVVAFMTCTLKEINKSVNEVLQYAIDHHPRKQKHRQFAFGDGITWTSSDQKWD